MSSSTQGHSALSRPKSRDSHATIGQFSFAPATTTTVITTTYTTTTTLAPMCINAPGLSERDPKEYPLAQVRAPESIRKIYFDAGGEIGLFEEAIDAPQTAHEHTSLQENLRASNGKIRKIDTFKGPATFTSPSRPKRLVTKQRPTLRSVSGRRKRDPTDDSPPPPSIREAAEMASLQRRSKKPRISTQDEDTAHMGITPDDLDDMVPATPETELDASQTVKMLSTNETLRQLRETTAGPSHTDAASCDSQQLSQSSSFPTGVIDGPGAAATPPIAESDMEPHFPVARPAPMHLDIAAAQDASLPSPSLSPTTYAANAQQSLAGTSSLGQVADYESNDVSSLDLSQIERPKGIEDMTPNPQLLTPTVSGIPEMLNAFDALPEGMKDYVMYQMLRRCKKSTLHFVADVVNPALKRDFITSLPTELGLEIIGYLDVQSMCNAARVSKHWRKLIDTHETAWKDLLEKDGFTLPTGELDRAVREGWGWQFTDGIESYERDLSRLATVSRSDNEHATGSASSFLADHDGAITRSSSMRQKRKAVSKHGGSKKQRKKGLMSTKAPFMPYPLPFEQRDGPNAYAQRAQAAIPDPHLGLSSLRNMHLFKSLYQRHHLIRKSWMAEDTKPRHIAFRAHQRHVVTCLQFDTDKILTGSDDTNINVYDTQTGALRSRLEGHEGGVWALQYEGNTLVSGSTDRSVRVWDIEKGRCTQVFQGHTSTVRCLVILKPTKIGETLEGKPIMMPKEELIITGSRDSTLRVWKLPKPGDRSIIQTGSSAANDLDNPYFVRALTGHHHSVRAIAAHGDTLVSGSYDCTVRVWKVSTGETIQRLQGHTQKVYSVVLDHARNRCISGSMDNLVKVWSLETGQCIFTLEGHTSLVGLLDLSHERLVSAAADSTLRIWDPENGQCKSRLCAHTGAITCFQHDGQKVISGSDRTLKMWNVKTGEFVQDLLTDLSGVWQVKFNERRCVAAVQRNSLTYIEVLDFGATRDGIPLNERGRRIVVNNRGHEIEDTPDADMIDATDQP
ncbi:WD40-repeat-containing domain protein [Boeremia exigua]|uniref:WD40-repeat-containing domain protein n=1 Tax=Boeremia exigua TaxID=749465 RepID=UPI001E8E6566|nr:WD40-repeat-containing domain protein [Boeremia exigua]KAH6633370.1 WD40-repeat-containing domain protein [Boeremia exigua]